MEPIWPKKCWCGGALYIFTKGEEDSAGNAHTYARCSFCGQDIPPIGYKPRIHTIPASPLVEIPLKK